MPHYIVSLWVVSSNCLTHALIFHLHLAWFLASCKNHMRFIGKPPNASFITSRVHIIMGFTMQQAQDFTWLVTQTLIGLAILIIVSLLQVTIFILVQAPFVGRERSNMLFLSLWPRLSIKELLTQRLRPFGFNRFSQSLGSPLPGW